jgi:hypothetical protein
LVTISGTQREQDIRLVLAGARDDGGHLRALLTTTGAGYRI